MTEEASTVDLCVKEHDAIPSVYPSIVNRVIASYQRNPNATALIIDGRSISYSKLLSMAHALALALKESPHKFCVLYIDNTLYRYIAMLAAWLADKTYIPILPETSTSRCKSIVRQLPGACYVLMSSYEERVKHLRGIIPTDSIVIAGPDLIGLDDQQENDAIKMVEGKNPYAVMIFTSGSTGAPKGVLISHYNLSHYIENACHLFQPDETDVFAHCTSYASDLHMHDFYVAWSVGAAVFVFADASRQRLPLEFKAYGITHCFMVPALAMRIQNDGFRIPNYLPDLKVCIFAGEPLTRTLATFWARAANNSRIFNLYGPAEATVAFTWHEWDARDQEELVPIGRALPGLDIHVFDTEGNELPDGKKGELYLSGPQVVDGYYNNEDKTAAAFVKFSNGKVWYRSGDLGSIHQDGVHFHGRIDDCIKIKGYRIERLDLETEISLAVGAKRVAAVPFGGESFCQDFALFVAPDDTLNIPEIKQQCAAGLPDYMQPTLVIIEPLPANANGKIDYMALNSRLEKLRKGG
ncbi:MAG: AMP-binding protein [Kordiimonadaceae bacterium]|nr:AMP-binding protein [Kordiimonadaceae bacterium]